MEFPEIEFPRNTRSYPSHTDVWRYLDSYARKFNITEHMKLEHLVEKVVSIGDGKWSITVRDLPKNQTETNIFDAVFVCSSSYSSPYYAYIRGEKEFNGKIMHSHDYRKPQLYKGENILVIGTGPSETDIANELHEVGNKITQSSQKSVPEVSYFKQLMGKARKMCAAGFHPIVIKGEVDYIKAPNKIVFKDKSHQKFDRIIYATGN
ncbi:senecionine N-oxygenase-like [Contarinia nasturtii]|uniref:senecionine N-oxygenase-like n=1 Tax=Contarinia nasturtii TaxID=265458 RepID=UPI0012D43869|nr:senecionine N-oxygenase-like [Contarinia nasturtii]